MFRRLLLVFTDPDLRKKIIYIILLLIAARLLAHVPIPVLRTQDISSLIDSDAVFGLLNTISGGAYGKLSIVMLGVGPYITASIVIQLLGVIVPKIGELQKEGEMGRQKINKWTRYIAVPLAALNSWGTLQFLSSGQTAATIQLPPVLTNPNITESFWYWAIVILAMTAGSIMMMWIGEIITEFKMGNGVSLLILSGIVARLPNQIYKFWQAVEPNFVLLFEKFSVDKLFNYQVWKAFLWENPTWTPIRSFVMFFVIFLMTLFAVIFINDAVRKLMVIYSRRGHTEGKSRTLENIKADLPIKVNIAGVLPIIFAVSFILFPTILSRFFVSSNLSFLRDGARSVETYLSANPTENAPIPQNLPKSELFGVYTTNDKDQLNAAKNFDPTTGQELFGFTLTTRGDVQNSFFEGTPLNDIGWNYKTTIDDKEVEKTYYLLRPNGTNLGFLPETIIRWNGILAYTLFYFILIIFFTYFYTSTIAFKTDDVAENLQKSGAYIKGYRPGEQTQNYLSYVSNRLNVAGSIFLAIIAIVPFIFSQAFQFGDGTLSGIVGGTTLLILVSVTIETLKQLEAQATAIDYQRFTKY